MRGKVDSRTLTGGQAVIKEVGLKGLEMKGVW